MLGKIVGKKINKTLREKKYLIIGTVLLIGSVWLLMGTVTCAIASLFFVYGGYTLIVSLLWGFTITAISFFIAGILLIVWSEE